ncbi:MAG: prepilin-type N-terminal cleavage/methylation domain-containing protein [Desulfohalobiaceae bacterium]
MPIKKQSSLNADQQGFSLLELLVALVVCALLAYSLFNAQKYSLYLASTQQKRWENLNFSQELFARQGLQELSRQPTETWIRFSGPAPAKWRSSLETDPDAYPWLQLQTDLQGTVLKWSWPVYR